MSVKLQVVSTTTDPIEDIVSSIEDGTWEYVEKDFDLLQYVKCLGPKKYVINDEKQLQCRNKTLDYSYVDRQVGKVNVTGDKSELKMPVLVYFPEAIDYEGVKFPTNSYGLVDDAHGTLTKVMLDIFNYDCYYVNFKVHLDSKKSNIRALGNMLNRVWKESQGVTIPHLRTEYHVLMDEAIANGILDGKLTDEQNECFLKRYAVQTGITRRSLGQFASSHKTTGGRRKPVKEYTPEMLKKEFENVETMTEYTDSGYSICPPRPLQSYMGEALAFMIDKCYKEEMRKAVIILYATTEKQSEGIETDTDTWSPTRIKKMYEDRRREIFPSIKQIDVIFLDSK
jgi:hypothetical protein